MMEKKTCMYKTALGDTCRFKATRKINLVPFDSFDFPFVILLPANQVKLVFEI